MSHIPSIHDAYGGFGQKPQQPSRMQLEQHPSNYMKQQSMIKPELDQNAQKYTQKQKDSLPSDASYSDYPTRLCCPKCRNVGITRMHSQLGTAAWVWCVLLAPFAGAGLICLCLDSCRDKVHYCTRCGNMVGKKNANVC